MANISSVTVEDLMGITRADLEVNMLLQANQHGGRNLEQIMLNAEDLTSLDNRDRKKKAVKEKKKIREALLDRIEKVYNADNLWLSHNGTHQYSRLSLDTYLDTADPQGSARQQSASNHIARIMGGYRIASQNVLEAASKDSGKIKEAVDLYKGNVFKAAADAGVESKNKQFKAVIDVYSALNALVLEDQCYDKENKLGEAILLSAHERMSLTPAEAQEKIKERKEELNKKVIEGIKQAYKLANPKIKDDELQEKIAMVMTAVKMRDSRADIIKYMGMRAQGDANELYEKQKGAVHALGRKVAEKAGRNFFNQAYLAPSED